MNANGSLGNKKVNIDEDFVNRLKVWRRSMRLSQAEAAAKLNIGRSYLNQVEKGHRKPGARLETDFTRLEHLSKPEVNTRYEVNMASSPRITEEPPPTTSLMVRRVRLATKLRADARELRQIADRLENEALSLEQSGDIPPEK